MNEVEPWSSRARRLVGAGGSRAGRGIGLAWAWFTDLGQGAWMLAVGVALAGALVLAIIDGRGGPEPSACGSARVAELRLVHSDGRRLTSAQAARLHRDSTLLYTLSGKAYGGAVGALKYAAQMAGAAQPGQLFDAGFSGGKYQSACGTYP
jgi:hypothetical protein